MSEESFQDKMKRARRHETNGPYYVLIADALQIAKEADQTAETLRAEIHELEDARGYWHSRCDDLENAVLSPIIFDPTDPRVQIGREYEFSNQYRFVDTAKTGFVVYKAVLVKVEPTFTHPFFFDAGSGHLWSCVFAREVKK